MVYFIIENKDRARAETKKKKRTGDEGNKLEESQLHMPWAGNIDIIPQIKKMFVLPTLPFTTGYLLLFSGRHHTFGFYDLHGGKIRKHFRNETNSSYNSEHQ